MTRTIWKLADPIDSRFAQAAMLGDERDAHCPICRMRLKEANAPLQLFWKPGSDVIGDFVWVPAARGPVVTDRAVEVMSRFGRLARSEVGFAEAPERFPKRQARVQLPYAGPHMSLIWPLSLASFDRTRSTAKPMAKSCGHEGWYLSGFAYRQTLWNKEAGVATRIVVPREPLAGLFVHEAELAGVGLFGVREFLGGPRLLCTDAVRQAMLDEGLTNVDFMDTGEVIPG